MECVDVHFFQKNFKSKKMKRGAKELKIAKQAEHRASFAMEGEVAQVNGATMEGGGQILRNCVALAAIVRRPLHVFAIRANRPRGGGLRPQHLQGECFFFFFFLEKKVGTDRISKGIDLVASMCQAKKTGFEVGSCEISFFPGAIRSDVTSLTADTKTAGSVCLLCQVALPVAVFGEAPHLTLVLRGGTNATQAPPIDYFIHALLPLLTRMGVKCAAKVRFVM
jgi:RNA 3'-terminal phosphate cyclase (ATP)